MTQNEYTFTKSIIDGNRVTVPKSVIDEWDLEIGDKLIVTFKRPVKVLRGIAL